MRGPAVIIVKTELTPAQWALLDAIWLQVLAENQGVPLDYDTSPSTLMAAP